MTTAALHRASGIFTRLNDEAASKRESRSRLRALRRDLASYATVSEVNDLMSAIDRHEGVGAEAVRSIVFRNSASILANRYAS